MMELKYVCLQFVLLGSQSVMMELVLLFVLLLMDALLIAHFWYYISYITLIVTIINNCNSVQMAIARVLQVNAEDHALKDKSCVMMGHVRIDVIRPLD